jgi:hypothetical protein
MLSIESSPYKGITRLQSLNSYLFAFFVTGYILIAGRFFLGVSIILEKERR